MRLNRQEVDALIRATRQAFGSSARIWLFGSRVDDNKKGGDIDLYIETDKESGLVAAKLGMLGAIWSTFGEQKIDILVRSRSRECSPMHDIAKSSGEELVVA
ncbi:MAG: nucleotidyltransferase domain-containing protein [Chlamydiota bacterium]